MPRASPYLRRVTGKTETGGCTYYHLECGHHVPAPVYGEEKPVPTRRIRCPECVALKGKPERRKRVCRVCGTRLAEANKGDVCFAHRERYGI